MPESALQSLATPPCELPPAFPQWMVAADPRLGAAEQNGLYQAFRLRRGTASGAMEGWRAVLRTVIFTGAGFGAAMVDAAWMICVAAPPIGVGMVLLRELRPRWNRCRLPLRLSETLAKPEKIHPQARLDLATVPADADDLLECLYLECRERQASWVPDAFAFVGGVAAGIHVELLDFRAAPALWLLTPVAAFLFLAWSLSRAVRGFLGAACAAFFVCHPAARWIRVRRTNPVLRLTIVAVAASGAGMLAAFLIAMFGIAIGLWHYQGMPYRPGLWLAISGAMAFLGIAVEQLFARPGVVTPELLPLRPADPAPFPGLPALLGEDDA